MKKTIIGLALSAALFVGCSTLSPMEKQQYENLMRQGAEPVETKGPLNAALLNLLPGGGDVYNGEWGAFALDFLFWPVSVVWAVPQGAITADNLNKKETVAYYSIGEGRNQGFDPNLSPVAPSKTVNTTE